jgi:hypothetical protein
MSERKKRGKQQEKEGKKGNGEIGRREEEGCIRVEKGWKKRGEIKGRRERTQRVMS